MSEGNPLNQKRWCFPVPHASGVRKLLRQILLPLRNTTKIALHITLIECDSLLHLVQSGLLQVDLVLYRLAGFTDMLPGLG